MPSGGQIGSGVKIAYSLLSPHSWITIPEVREITSLPNRERDRVETTVHGVTGDRTYIPGLSDVGDLEFIVRANLDAGSVHTNLRALERAQTTIWVRVEVPVDPDLSTSTYVAYTNQVRVATWELSPPLDDLKTIRIVMQHQDNLMFQDEMNSAIS